MEFDEHTVGTELNRTMALALRELPAPSRDLVEGAITVGRRTRRRRQLTAWGAACTAAAIVAGTVLLTGGGSGQAPSVASATVRIPSLALAAAQAGPPPGKAALTGQATVKILQRLLPEGTRTSGHHWQSADQADSAVQTHGQLLMDLADGQAEVSADFQARFTLAVLDAPVKSAAQKSAQGPAKCTAKNTAKDAAKTGDRPDKAEAAKQSAAAAAKKARPATRAELLAFYSCDTHEFDGAVASCHAGNLADGSVLMTFEERSGALVRRTADLLRKDGTRIVVSTSNAPDSKHGPADIASPPLSTDQLTRIATSPRWQQWVDAATIKAAEQQP